tara:strand:+ start:60 stop:794 length:735 start_codon:yes stop_codon:yes gene_type:complete
MFYKQPSRRVKPTIPDRVGKIDENSFLGKILKKSEVKPPEKIKRPVYNQDDYLKLLEKNNKEMGIPYVKPDLPEWVPVERPKPPEEPELDVPDRVYLKLRVLKSGIVRVKLNCAIWDLYNKYYKNAQKAPFKAILQAYKSHGFSKEYLEKLKKNYEKRKLFALKVEKLFAKIFDKEPVKKPKKEKEKEKKKKEPEEDEEVIDNPPEEDEDDDDVASEDGGMDIEPDADEEVVEDVEEEYFSDGE